jgi:hypothetical protein
MAIEYYIGIDALVVCLGILITIALVGYWMKPKKETNQVPLAQPHIPLLGNALAYKDHPDKFLCLQAKQLGPIFRINLAGMETYVLSSRATLKQFALAPDNVLSSMSAVADFGFKYTLGERNVFEGSEFHKNVVKANFSSPSRVNLTTARFMKSLDKSIESELSAEKKKLINLSFSNDGTQRTIIDDFLPFSRRVILRGVVEVFLSVHFVDVYQQQHGEKGSDDFVSHFMIFQDLVEEATASAAVLPFFLAYILVLQKCANKRKILTEKIGKVVQRLWADTDSGELTPLTLKLQVDN